MADALIIIPTYNERENLEEFISAIFRHISDIHILIVDDASSDGTDVIADKITEKDNRVSVLHRFSRRGRGYAGIDAFREALRRKDILCIMEMDADFSHDSRYIPYFLEEIKRKDNDIVIGSRFIEGGEDTERGFLRNILSKAVNLFIRGYLGLKVTDCSSGYRCFKRLVIASLDLDSIVSKGPAIIEEVLYISKLKKYKIKEIPIVFKKRAKGKTKLNFIKLLRVLMDILRFKNLYLDKEKKESTVVDMRKFGFKLALALNIVGFIMFYRQRGHFIWFTGIGSLNLIFAIICPIILIPVKKILDFFILSIGRLVNIITLMTAFYLIFTPIGILLRVFRKDLLHQRIDKRVGSYWIKRRKDSFSKDFYEQMG